MTNPTDPALTPEEIATLIAYARRKYREEQWPFALELRPIRELLAKMEPWSEPERPRTKEELWNELDAVSGTLERLRRELGRCQGPSKYRNDLELDIATAAARRDEILAELQKSA